MDSPPRCKSARADLIPPLSPACFPPSAESNCTPLPVPTWQPSPLRPPRAQGKVYKRSLDPRYGDKDSTGETRRMLSARGSEPQTKLCRAGTAVSEHVQELQGESATFPSTRNRSSLWRMLIPCSDGGQYRRAAAERRVEGSPKAWLMHRITRLHYWLVSRAMTGLVIGLVQVVN